MTSPVVVTSSPAVSGMVFALLVEVGLEEGVVVAAGDEADLLRVGLLGDGEAGVGGHLADGGLLHLAKREEGAAELLLREAEEEVGLVLRLCLRGGRGSSGRASRRSGCARSGRWRCGRRRSGGR